MRPTFQTASEDLKQTSILHLKQMHKCEKYHIVYGYLFLSFPRHSVFLNPDLRAVEFFIRDKYEKKKYYSKNVTNGSSVCTDLTSSGFRRS